jgi:uncharacterized membrane protein
MAHRVLVGVLLLALGWGCGKSAPVHEKVRAEGGFVRLPRLAVADGGVHFFTFVHEGANVNFLFRTDGNGMLHSHLDACYSCFKYKLGFVHEGEDVVCIACRLKYPIEKEFWDYIGACAPIPIHSETVGEFVVIEEALLQQAARYF